MDVKVISLTNDTGASIPYGVLESDSFNGSQGGRVTENGGAGMTSWVGKLALALLLSSFVVVALAGNLLVIVAVVTDRNLRRTNNYFIVSLALADALVAAAVMTFAIVNDVLGRWVFGARTCRAWMSADVMCSTASILNLCAIGLRSADIGGAEEMLRRAPAGQFPLSFLLINLCAISLDRYVHVRSPLHYDRLVTHRRSLAAIALVWIMSALISFLPIHLGWHRVDGGVVTATVALTTNSSTPSYIHSLVHRSRQHWLTVYTIIRSN